MVHWHLYFFLHGARRLYLTNKRNLLHSFPLGVQCRFPLIFPHGVQYYFPQTYPHEVQYYFPQIYPHGVHCRSQPISLHEAQLHLLQIFLLGVHGRHSFPLVDHSMHFFSLESTVNVCNLRLRSDSIPQAAQRGHTILHKWDSSIRIPFLQSPSGKLNRSISIRPCSQNCCFDFLPFQPTWNSCPLLQYCRSFSPIQHCCKRLRLFSQRFSSVESFVLRQTLWSD